VYDYVLWTASRALQQQVDVRRAFSRDDYREVLTKALQQLSATLLDEGSAAEFASHMAGNQQLTSEFNVGLFLDPSGPLLGAASLISLTGFDAQGLERGELLANGSRLRPDAESLAVAAVLREARWTRFDTLCERIPQLSHETIYRAVRDLARHEIVTIWEEPRS
jgi:hypothetical protein